MAWFSDLSSCAYFGEEFAGALKAIGWLERGREYPVGRAEQSIYRKLVALRREPWQPMVSMGVHECDLCQYEGEIGSANIFIPANGFLYVCPELITHYMNAHGYLPPDEFCEAVLSCPEMRSVAYMKAILANGGRPLVSAGR